MEHKPQRPEREPLTAPQLVARLAAALTGLLLGVLAPRCLTCPDSLRRLAMTSYLLGCALLLLGAMQVTTDGLGLAVTILPVAASSLTLAIGCHARLHADGIELVPPES